MEEVREKSYLCLSSFWLKVIAIITMTIDHIGALLQMNVGANYWVAILCRSIGRLSLPLFVFMIVEGIRHTKSVGKYFLRLGIMASIISAAFIVCYLVPSLKEYGIYNFGNIFIDLILVGLITYLFNQKEPWKKALIIIPFIYSIISFVVTSLENPGNMIIHWFPFFIRGQYDLYTVVLAVLFNLTKPLSRYFLKWHEKQTGLPAENLYDTDFDLKVQNLINFGAVVIGTLIYFALGLIMSKEYVYWDYNIQTYAIISGALLLLYNGKRGYNAKWFQYGSYIYYPLHILLIFGIGLLIG